MSTTNASQTSSGQPETAPESDTPITDKISESVTKGLSQPPSRSQVPPATAAEEIIQ